jgi:hypothetical protein
MKKRKSEESPWKPKGSGWRKIPTTKDKPWKMQWKHAATGCIRRDFGDYVEINNPRGGREYSGKGGGRLIFNSNGKVELIWNSAAAIASAHGSGNRKYRITKGQSNRESVQLDETFAMINELRGMFIGGDDNNFGIPTDAEDPKTIELIRTFHREAWRFFSSVIKGDSEDLEKITAAVKHHENIRSGREAIGLADFEPILAAICNAAEKANGIPSRATIQRELEKLLPINRQIGQSLRDRLFRIGFGWVKR